MAISTNGTVLTRVAGALYNVQMSNATYSEVASLDPSTLVNTLYSRDFGTKTDLEVATTLIANLGLSAVTGLDNWVAAQLTAAGANKGAKVVSMLNDFAQMSTTDATYGAAVAAFNTKVDAALALSQTTGNAGGTFAAAGTAVVAGSTFTLTTNVDDINGNAGDDVVKGVLGTSGTYGVGDDLNGGSGSDTLNLISNGSAIAGGLVGIDSVETINVRLLTSAGEVATLNATDWSGVETVTNASSLASTVLTVTGLAVTTDVMLVGQTTINAGFANTTTATAAVNVILSNAGSGTTSTGFATLNVDANNAGLISSVAVDLQGTTNAAYLEGGASVTKYTVTGSAKGYLNTNDTVTSFDASAATGALDVTFSGQSDVVAVGGAGADTFRFGSNFNNGDSFDGGAGNDTIALTLGTFGRNLNTVNVENATVTFSEGVNGTLNASGSTVTTFTIAGTAGNASVSQISDGATIKLSDNDTTSVTLDFVSGALSTTIQVGSAASMDIGSLTVTDVAAVTLTSTGSGAAAVAGAIDFDADVKTVVVTNGTVNSAFNVATADAVTLTGATTLTVTSSGSGSITFGSAIAANKLGSLTINAAGSESADVTVADTTLTGSGITSIVVNAADGADATLGALNLGNQGSASSAITLAANVTSASSNVTVGNISVSGAGSLTLDFSQIASGDIQIGTINLARMDASGAQSLSIDALTVANGATVDLGDVTMVSAGSGSTVTIGAITVDVDGTFTAGAINADAVVGANMRDITITLGASANSYIGALSFASGAIGNLDLTVAAYASAEFSTFAASGMGSIEINAAGGRGYVDLGGITVGKNIGTIEVTGAVDSSDVTIGAIGASGVGAISVAGAGNFTLGKITATNVGTVTSTQGVSGAFTIDLSGVTNAVEVVLGKAVNFVQSGLGNDVISLSSGSTGNDSLVYSTADQGNDLISGFGAGTTATAGGADLIVINASAMPLAVGSGSLVTTATDVSLLMFTGASAVMGSASNIVVMTTAFASTAAMVTQLTQLSWSTAQASGADRVLVVWGNGDDSYVSIASVTNATAYSTWASAAAIAVSDTTLLTLDGVSAGQLVATNFDFI